MKENFFAISIQQTPKNMQRYATFNVHKMVIVGPGELAIHLTEALLKNPAVLGDALSSPERSEHFSQGVPDLACKLASNLWQQMTMLGWVLDQDLPETVADENQEDPTTLSLGTMKGDVDGE